MSVNNWVWSACKESSTKKFSHASIFWKELQGFVASEIKLEDDCQNTNLRDQSLIYCCPKVHGLGEQQLPHKRSRILWDFWERVLHLFCWLLPRDVPIDQTFGDTKKKFSPWKMYNCWSQLYHFVGVSPDLKTEAKGLVSRRGKRTGHEPKNTKFSVVKMSQ